MMTDADEGMFAKEWHAADAHLLFAEILHRGDTSHMPRLFGFAYGGHLFTLEDGTITFFKNKETERRAAEAGAHKYRDSTFPQFLGVHVGRIEANIRQTLDLIGKETLPALSNQQLWQLHAAYVEHMSELYACYRFTRKDFYARVIEDIKAQLPEPKEETLNTLLRGAAGVPLPAPFDSLIESLRTVGKLRWHMHKVWLDSFERGERLFEEVGRRVGLSAREVKHSLSGEVQAYLLEGAQPDKVMLQKRMSYAAVAYTPEGFTVTTERVAVQQKTAPVDEVQGMPAHPGCVRGTVRIIREALRSVDAVELSRVRKGDIIVTNMTSPDMILAMERAAAFVTNEGGTLCHAAVLAREMGKPCIVSTRHATDVFKDGDLVEVDANQGIVRKLE